MERTRDKVKEIWRETKRVAKEDPRRVVHSFKVGLALALVSSIYYYQPLYDNFGVNAMWAVMTVVVVFEFSVGATLGKGLNRGAATLLAGALAMGAHHLASMSGPTGEPILLAIFVFLQAAISTFIRFFPRVKARYDYGMLIFILTFSLISVSGFREDEILDLAHKRLSTVIIGGAACVIVSIFVCPVWAGQDLHHLIGSNLTKLGNFLEEFGEEYFKGTESGDNKDMHKIGNLEGYKSVLNSKSIEDSLANFAKWEPRHGKFKFRHPWKQYLALGVLIRQCGYRIDTLNSYLEGKIQVSMEIKNKLEEPLRRISSETGKAMKELSFALKEMTKPSSSSDLHIQNSDSAAKSLKTLFKSKILNDIEPLEVAPLATTASLLIDIVNLTIQISESINELANSARFKKNIDPTLSPQKPSNRSIVLEAPNDYTEDHVVTIVTDTSESVNQLPANSVRETTLEYPHVVITIDEPGNNKQELGDMVTNGDSDAVNNLETGHRKRFNSSY